MNPIRMSGLPRVFGVLAVAISSSFFSSCSRSKPPAAPAPPAVQQPTRTRPEEPTDAVRQDARIASAKEVPEGKLYGNYCAACHGENGDGNGPAARFLFKANRRR